MNNAMSKLPALVAEELEASNRVYPPFRSAHEGYAVLLEEVDESRFALSELEELVRKMWAAIKTDELNEADCNAYRVEICARELAAEAIQVAAMAKKFQNYCTGERVRLHGKSQ